MCKCKTMWDTLSFFIGILFGMIIMMVICWISFSTRTFIFTGCVKDEIQCRRNDYYNDPSNAITEEGVNPNDILYIEVFGKKEELMYRRVPKTKCRPGPGQDVHILHPQFCSFSIKGASNPLTGKNHRFESPYYTITDSNGVKYNVLTSKDCNPIRIDENDNIISGSPLVQWEGY